MFNFFKRNKEIPSFNFIETYPKKDMYFSRNKKWNWLNGKKIFLADKDSDGKTKMISLDYWFQEMFLDADGQKTISEYLKVLINQFQESNMKIPSDLDQFMIETLESLNVDLNAIKFTSFPGELDIEFDKPMSEKSGV